MPAVWLALAAMGLATAAFANADFAAHPDANFMGQPIRFAPNTQIEQFAPEQNDTVSSVRPCN